MQKRLDDETREILISFIAEGYERLDDSEAQLSKIGEGDNTAELNSIFRLFHSVKGSAGFLGLENIKNLTHEAETMLDVFLKEKIPVTQDALDVVYSTVDVLRALIGIVEKEYSDETGAESAKAQTAIVAAMIRQLRENAENPAPQAPQTAPQTAPPEPQPAPTAQESIPNEITLSDLVTSDMVHRFLGECADLADRTEKIALAINPKDASTDQVNDMFRAIHTIKGNSGFFGYAHLESLCMNLESSLDAARKSGKPVGEAFVNAVMSGIDRIRLSLSSLVIHEKNEASQSDGSNVTVASTALPAADQQAAQTSGEPYKPLGEILVTMGAVKDETLQEALSEQERPIGEILLQKGIVDREQIDKALKLQKSCAPATEQETPREVIRKEIRVDTAKLDKLFDLVGELITAESMVVNSVSLTGDEQANFAKSFSGLTKISREIQETTMMIRMIPLDGLFQKMTRLVRDLSRKMDKPVNFIVSGQDTEMDKNVIEQISDPLVHILRNAIDHGIESKEARMAGGKQATGTVQLNARYEGSDIWISVKDDGAGLDRDRILAKAQEKGLLKTDPSAVSDKEAFAFIFEPGFSTAEIVSEVSGRGVGLDVVKKNLEQIRGRIEIKTVPGAGTEFILIIPLTMAIIDGITVRVGGNRYSLPLNDIIEFFKVNPEQITKADKTEETVNIRTSFLPLIKLWQVFNIPDAFMNPVDGIIIVVHNNGRKACLLIDEVIGNQQIVVKSLSEYLGKVDGISGCSILGDGSVSFIIDTGRLLAMRIE
jgi:two-component system chemotaxis sensor kinase CheA